ncbi:MAG: T9SS type A sorting domain-containing protein [Calditrichaeota bacterium]|nr:T9SS type A sorting domain-containing protein [Calditrichota bacterium]
MKRLGTNFRAKKKAKAAVLMLLWGTTLIGNVENGLSQISITKRDTVGQNLNISSTALNDTLLSFSSIAKIAGIDSESTFGGHATIFADVNEDGLPDLYITYLFNGLMSDQFYLNYGDCKFREEAQSRGIDDPDGGSHGACFADLDNDGDYDLINGTTRDALGFPDMNNIFVNDGSGNFSDKTQSTDLILNKLPTRAVIAFDMEGDGDLDIFCVSNYLGSDDPPDEPNELYRNDGNLQFTTIDSNALKFAPAGQGATATDIDNDGDIDIIAGNRTGPLNILINDGRGNFELIAPDSIGIFHERGECATTADVDNDGDLDLLLTGFDTGYLYLNDSTGVFSFHQTFSSVDGYMGGFADLDNDGDLDIVFAGDDVCYLNDGKGNFEAGPQIPVDGINDPRSISFADIDNDGDLDFAVGCKRSLSLLIRNNLKYGNWVNVKLESALGQAGAFGARVYVYPIGLRGKNFIMMQEAQSSQGYLGQNDPILHFGVGNLSQVDVVVKFLDGRIVEKNLVAVNQTIFVKPELDTTEVISPPKKPTVQGDFLAGTEVIANTDSAKSNRNHRVEYQFDWGDSSLSVWGDSIQTHVFQKYGEYEIRARARCKIHPNVVSSWSEPSLVTIVGLNCHVSVQPQGAGQVIKTPLKEEYAFGDSLILIAEPDSGFDFVGWDGDTSATVNPLTMVLTHDFDVAAIFSLITETITVPNKLVCQDSTILGKNIHFTTGGAISNLDHEVEYQFDWGDSTFSEWVDSSGTHIYASVGNFQVKSRARCRVHHSVISDWSSGRSVSVRSLKIFVQIIPDSAGSVQVFPEIENYAFHDSVTLIAVPGNEMQFSRWTGDIEGDDPEIKVVLSKDLHVQCRFEKITEVLTAPELIQGSRFLYRKQSGTFVAKSARSNLKHPLEYQFDWGDGNLSYWGDSVQTRTYYENGISAVRCRVRCGLHRNVLSDWSDSLTVQVRGCKISKKIIPQRAGVIDILPEEEDYDFDEPINISAHPAPNFKFLYWNSGQDSAVSLQIKISSDTTIIAHFGLLSGIEEAFGSVPKKYALLQNYPNPFNMETTIAYQIPKNTHVRLVVYNVSGQEVAVLVDKNVTPGFYDIRWKGFDNQNRELPSGVYWFVLDTAQKKLYRKMVLLR